MNWVPAHADHAIDSVTLAISLEQPIDPNTFDELVVVARRSASPHQYTHRVDGIEPIHVQPGVEVVLDGSAMMSRRRVSFQRQAQGKTIGEFAIGSTSIALASSRYTSWTAFCDMAVDLLAALQQVLDLTRQVKSVQLQYVDTFTSTSTLADHFEVLNAGSKYLAGALAAKGRALHCHLGWFDYPVGSLERVLSNVNIGIVDNSPPAPADAMSKITILTMVRYEALQGVLVQPFARLPDQHAYLKSLFRDIITPQAAARISLDV